MADGGVSQGAGSPQRLGLIVPVLDEAPALPGCLDHLLDCPWPVCVVDGGSDDDSVAIASRHAAVSRIMTIPGGRHRQLTAALEAMACTWVVVLPVDARLSQRVLGGLNAEIACAQAPCGCLRAIPSDPTWPHRWRVALSRLRARLTGGAYVDQIPWFHRETALAVGGFHDCGPFDSADLGRRLRRFGRFAALGAAAVVSCREYRRDGWWRAFWRQQSLRWRHSRRGVSWAEQRQGPAGRPIRTLLAALLLLAVLPACSWPATSDLPSTITWVEQRHPAVRHVDPAAVRADDEGLLLFDVRAPEEYAISHLAGAQRWVDLATANDLIAERRAQRVILYCSVGERSSRAAARLQEAHPDLPIANLRGGIFAWAIAGLPLFDPSGTPTTLVHPYDAQWGRLLPEAMRHSGAAP